MPLVLFDNELDTVADFTVGMRLDESAPLMMNRSGRIVTKPQVNSLAQQMYPDWHKDSSIERPSHPEDDWWHKHPTVQSLIKGHGDESYVPKNLRMLQRHFNTSWKMDLPNGQEGVFKSLAQETPGGTRPYNIKSPSFRREALAWEHAHTLGLGDLVPPTVVRDMPGRGVGSYQHWVDKSLPGAEYHKGGHNSPFDGPVDHSRAAAFDYLTGQLDRHIGNWLITPKNKLALIDNGSSYPETAKMKSSLPNLPMLRGESDLLRRATLSKNPYVNNSGLTLPPEAAKWGKNEDKLLRAMQRHKSTENEIEQFRERLHHISRASKDKRSFRDLLEASPFGYMNINGDPLAPEQDLHMLHRRIAG